jgi:hypothetical protein
MVLELESGKSSVHARIKQLTWIKARATIRSAFFALPRQWFRYRRLRATCI